MPSAPVLIALCSIAAFLLLNYCYGHWKRRGIRQLSPVFPFGNFSDLFRGRASFSKCCENLYEKTRQWPLFGGYVTLRPVLFVNDWALARKIMVQDFGHFHDRGANVDERHDPLSGHLFSLAGDKWRTLRAKLTPTFTSGRLKGMFQTLVDTGVVMQEYLESRAKADGLVEVEIRDLLARYNTDNIASVAFGIKVDSVNNPEEPFRQIGRKIFASNFRNNMRGLLTFMTPKLARLLRVRFVDLDVERFIIGVVRDTLEYRIQHGISRKDMMQLLLQLRQTGTVSVDERWDVDASSGSSAFRKFTLEEVAAQAHVFFIAGFETSSTTMSFCLYELARNPELQRKAQQEVDQVMRQNGGKLTYDGINGEMRFLEACVDETLRKYPPVPVLNRECTREYQVPGTDIRIEKGTAVVLQIAGMQHDPEFYPDPLKFRPERFMEPEMDQNRPYAPFGDGPRICIGMRMGKIQTKVGLSLLLAKFNFELAPEHNPKEELPMDPNSFIPTPRDGIRLRVSCR